MELRKIKSNRYFEKATDTQRKIEAAKYRRQRVKRHRSRKPKT
jgi:hypothetical protein